MNKCFLRERISLLRSLHAEFAAFGIRLEAMATTLQRIQDLSIKWDRREPVSFPSFCSAMNEHLDLYDYLDYLDEEESDMLAADYEEYLLALHAIKNTGSSKYVINTDGQDMTNVKREARPAQSGPIFGHWIPM